MFTLLAQSKTSIPSAADIPWQVVTGVAVVLVLFSLLLMFVKRYKRCPSNRVLVVFGKTGGGNAA